MILVLCAVAVPFGVGAQSGTYFDPIHVQIQPDMFDSYVQQTQNQWQIDSLNQSLQNIQNALNAQTQQQSAYQRQQLIQQAQGQCPTNMTVYVSKVTGKIGGCVCQTPYVMQGGSCISPWSVKQSQQTATQVIYVPTQTTPAQSDSQARQLQQQINDVVSAVKQLAEQRTKENTGATSAPESPTKSYDQRCKEEYDSNSKWSGVVDDVARTFECECEQGYHLANDSCVRDKETTKENAPVSFVLSSTTTPAPESRIERRGFWSWLRSWFGI